MSKEWRVKLLDVNWVFWSLKIRRLVVKPWHWRSNAEPDQHQTYHPFHQCNNVSTSLTSTTEMSLARSKLSTQLSRVSRRNIRLAIPSSRRYLSQTPLSRYDAPASKTDASEPPGDSNTQPSSLVREEGPSEGTPRHRPDYDAPIDHGTS